ncbi:60S ribosomal protein L14-A [Diplonema papillatum]|nr:60S ribosomal protein L14-A [Diplonema papillatum]
MPSTNEWRFIEIGRLVLLTKGKYEGKVATIVDVVDQNRVLLDSPASSENCRWTGVPRHVVTMKDIEPTPIKTEIQRGLRLTGLKKEVEKQKTLARWGELAWAKKLVIREARTNISDFDRFRVDRARRVRAFTLRKKLADKLKSSGKDRKAKKVFKA